MPASLNVITALWLSVVLLAPQAAAAEQRAGTLTGKEKLAGKASDEQRVNNCKVPLKKRGSKARSAECSRKSNPQNSPAE